MAKSSKKKQNNKYEQKVDVSSTKLRSLTSEVQDHYKSADTYVDPLRKTWDEKEALLIGSLTDDISNSAKSQIFDPRLSTIVFERAARVSAQEHIGHAYAESKDDIGKNALMNLLLGFYTRNANEQYSMPTKLRMFDLYSLVYGSYFGLVPWRINGKRDYIGPEFVLIPIRDIFPQPDTVFSDADWVQVRSWVSLDWLKNQDPSVWKNVDKLEGVYKDSGGDIRGVDSSDTSFIERNRYGLQSTGDTVFPKVELITEYRCDKWITFVPERSVANKNGHDTQVLRVLENEDSDGRLPVVKKDAFPLIDSVFGLGEFERGASLQKGINSLINLYMDGVKYSIFPPVHINPDAVGLKKSSIVWAPGAKWFMGRPNADVQVMSLSPQGINSFNSTYGFMVSALQNAAGTSSISDSRNVESTLGKTPQAVQYMAAREDARDSWDRFMLEESIREIYGRWISLIDAKLENEQVVRLYGSELKTLQKKYPDIVERYGEVSTSKSSGSVKVKREDLRDASDRPTRYDYRVEVGSTMQADPQAEAESVMNLFKLVIENPSLVQQVEAAGKKIDLGELFERVVSVSGVKDWDKIVVDQETAEEQEKPVQADIPQMLPTGQPPVDGIPPQALGAPMNPPGMPMDQSVGVIQQGLPEQQGYGDPEIDQFSRRFFNRISDIPAQ